MFPDLSSIDLLKVSGVFVATTLLIFSWLFWSAQNKIPRTAFAASGIAIRNLVAHALILVVMTGWGTWTVDEILAFLPLWLILFALSFPGVVSRLPAGAFNGPDVVGIIVVAFIATSFVVFVGPIFLLRQFVLGFVDIKAAIQSFREWQQEPRTREEKVDAKAKPDLEDAPNFVAAGARAVVVATLRPLGKVRINDQEHDARHI